MKRVAPFLLAIALIVGCQSSSLLEPEADVVDLPEHAIADGEHVGGNSHFFWLPPLVHQPDFDGEFDPDLSVTVEICEFADGACGSIIETFTDVPVVDDHYQVNWHTKRSDLVQNEVYRATVRVGTTELGFADFVALKKVSGKKKGTDPFPLKIGRTFPIKFRIELGIVGQVVITPSEATIRDNETQDFTATVTDLHGDPIAGLTVLWSVGDPTVATLDPTEGTTDDAGETMTTATPPTESPTLNSPTTVFAETEGVKVMALLTVEPSTFAPTANDDSYGPFGTFPLDVDDDAGLLANDVGDPAPGVTHFGGGSLGGAVGDNAAGDAVAFGTGGSLTVNANGSFTFTPSSGFTGDFTFDYEIDNGIPPTSVGTVTIQVEAMPMVQSTAPADAATDQPVDTDITVTFSEPVTVGGSWFQTVCTASGTRNVGDAAVAGGPTTFTIDPNVDFTEGESCTTTIDKDEITDQDGAPDNMAADFVFTFTTDVAPSVVSSDPANGDIDVLSTESIAINFSEIVNATTNSFTIECPAPGNLQPFSLSGSPASSFTLTPSSNLPAGTTCTVTVIATEITDADAGDPPDNLATDFTFSFTLPVVAHDDIYPETVTGNVSVNSANVGGGAFSVTGNDEASNPITITAFDATSANGGTVSMTLMVARCP
jgi:methionine-rich copper-binding protein CopC